MDVDQIQVDADGYPPEGVYEIVRDWPYERMQELFERLAEVWPFYGRFEYRGEGSWEVATGGWSGCEELVGALMANTMVHSLAWIMSRRGGYYEFEVPEFLRGA